MNISYSKNHYCTEIAIDDSQIFTASKVTINSERGVYPLLPTPESPPKMARDDGIKHTIVLQGVVSADGNIPDLFSKVDFDLKIGRFLYSLCSCKKVSQQISDGELCYSCVIESYVRSERNG